jgi:two-component system, cell cycle response regulator
MTQSNRAARVLVVDDEHLCRSVIVEHLGRVGYEVFEAENGAAALELARDEPPDLIILDLCMPGIDGFTVCRELRSRAQSRDTPILLLTALSDRDSKFEGLAAGADDFLAKPVFSAELLMRVRNLLKIKFLKDQLDAVQNSVQQMLTPEAGEPADSTRVLLAVSEATRLELGASLAAEDYCLSFCVPAEALQSLQSFQPDVLILEPFPDIEHSFEVCRAMRARSRQRTVPILLLSAALDSLTRLSAFEAGVDEYLGRPFHPAELVARLRSHASRHQEQRQLERRFHSAAQRAIRDGLTGAHNRAFFDQHLHYQCKLAARYHKPLSVIMLDLDHFKEINDSFGHPVGDDVLRKAVELIRGVTRSSDVLCRYGGDELALLLPDTGKADALFVAERIRSTLANPSHWSFIPARVTASLGIATFGQDANAPGDLIDAADQALYRAKHAGRNRVFLVESSWGADSSKVEPLFGPRAGAERPDTSVVGQD